MDSKQYMENVKRTESANFTGINERLLHGVIGVATESGELLDVVKKALFYNREINSWSIIEEVGDVFWYLGLICDYCGVTFEEVMDKNIKKLKERYPEQFTEEREQNRDYEKEKKAALDTE